MLEIVRLELGPVLTNSYLIADPETGEAVVIDPAWDGHLILAARLAD
jgi:glyoxylase-like metal-dependent hydrolase (beta-lactamase superfamily II)